MAGRDDATPGNATARGDDQSDPTAPGVTTAATRPLPRQDSAARQRDARRSDTGAAPAEADERPTTDVRHSGDMRHGGEEKSLGQLVASATRDLSALIRGEISLAKAELKQSAAAAGKGVGMFGAAAILAFVAVLMLSTAAAFGLVAAGLHPAVGFAVVGGAWLLLAGLLAYVGKRSVRKARPPERTIHSLEEARGIVTRGNATARSRPSTPQSPDGA